MPLVALFLFRIFRGDEGLQKKVTVEDFLSYWLSRYVLSSGPEDGINAYVFPLVVRLTRGKNYDWVLYTWDRCTLAWTSAFETSPPRRGVMM